MSLPALAFSFAASDALPGWFGKLPGMGDFAHRRLPEAFRSAWDRWLQQGLTWLRERHAEDWVAHYLEAPVWFFALGPQVVGERGWLGVLMPSVDGVGRYFPFTLAVELDVEAPSDVFSGVELVDALRWWRLGARAALQGLEGDLDARRFDLLLAQLFEEGGGASGLMDACDGDVGLLAMPGVGASLWVGDPASDSGVRMVCEGLPVEAGFEVLFLGGGG